MTKDEVVSYMKELFPDLPLKWHGEGVSADFLSIELVPVPQKGIKGERMVAGYHASYFDGEDDNTLYIGSSAEQAFVELAKVYAQWKVQKVFDKFNPCMVVSK